VAVDAGAGAEAEVVVFVVAGRVVVGAGAFGAASTITAAGAAVFGVRFGTATFLTRPTLSRAGFDIDPVVMGPSLMDP
jgi:hypothetical protein